MRIIALPGEIPSPGNQRLRFIDALSIERAISASALCRRRSEIHRFFFSALRALTTDAHPFLFEPALNPHSTRLLFSSLHPFSLLGNSTSTPLQGEGRASIFFGNPASTPHLGVKAGLPPKRSPTHPSQRGTTVLQGPQQNGRYMCLTANRRDKHPMHMHRPQHAPRGLDQKVVKRPFSIPQGERAKQDIIRIFTAYGLFPTLPGLPPSHTVGKPLWLIHI